MSDGDIISLSMDEIKVQKENLPEFEKLGGEYTNRIPAM